MNMANTLHDIYLEEFNKIKPIFDYLRDNWSKYSKYLGWKDLNSPIIDNPDILFIGINPGPGRYDTWNYGKKSDYVLPVDYPTPWRTHIGWLTDNNARCYKNSEKDAPWWDKAACIKNMFPYYMCKLLERIYFEQTKGMSGTEKTAFYESRVMVTNLYPLVTRNTNGLSQLLAKMGKESRLRNAETMFINHILFLIELVKPRLVVFLGKGARNGRIVSELKKSGIQELTLSREHGWHSNDNLSSFATQIRNIIFE